MANEFELQEFAEVCKPDISTELVKVIARVTSGNQLYLDEDGYMTANPLGPDGESRQEIGVISSMSTTLDKSRYSYQVHVNSTLYLSMSQIASGKVKQTFIPAVEPKDSFKYLDIPEVKDGDKWP